MFQEHLLPRLAQKLVCILIAPDCVHRRTRVNSASSTIITKLSLTSADIEHALIQKEPRAQKCFLGHGARQPTELAA